MNILTSAYGEGRTLLLIDFLKEMLPVNDKEVVFLKNFKDIIMYIDKVKYPDKSKINRKCVIEWSELKSVFLASQYGFNTNTCFFPSSTKVCLLPHRYSSGSTVISLFEYDIWKMLYDLIGTELMKLILFSSSLYLPLNDKQSYLAINKESACRILNKLTKPKLLVRRNKNITPIVSLLNTKTTSVTALSNKSKGANAKSNFKMGFNGTILLSFNPILHGKCVVKVNSEVCSCPIESPDEIDRISKCLLQNILLQDVGVNIHCNNVDLTDFENILKDFIRRNYKIKTCCKIINRIFKIHCSNCQIKRMNPVKRKKQTPENENPSKKLKTSDNKSVVTINKKQNRRLHSLRKRLKLESVDPVSLPRVKRFIRSILQKVLPQNIFELQNNNYIIKNLLHVFKYGRFQCFELRDLLIHIDINKIKFLRKIKSVQFKWNILAKFLLWLLCTYIFLILNRNFYITECRENFNKLQFYKIKDWQILKHCMIYKLQKSIRLRPLTKHLLEYQKRLGIRKDLVSCRLRFIPKGKFDARPIIWCKSDEFIKICQVYLGQLCAFNIGSKKLNDLLELHNKWLYVHKNWKFSNNSGLYFVKVDITDAYGSIRLKHLLSLLKRKRAYFHIFCESNTNVKKIVRKLLFRKLKCFKRVRGAVSCKYIYRFDELPSNVPRNCIIVPTDDVKVVYVKQLYHTLKQEILFKNVTVGRETFLITKGIPQGGPLSSHLCQLYFDLLDSEQLKEFCCEEEDLLIRAVDDYLYVTPVLDRAKKYVLPGLCRSFYSGFLLIMEKGFSDLHCFINKKKTCTNFGENSKDEIKFYGLQINTKTMEVYGNYDNYKGVNIFHTITFTSRNNPGQFLKNRLSFINSLKLNDIILDPIINSKSTIVLSIMRASLLMAFRYNAIVKNILNSHNPNFLINCTLEFAKIIVSRMITIKKQHHNISDDSVVDSNMVSWTVYKAFFMKLDREKEIIAAYEMVLKHLKTKLMIIFSKLSKENQDILRNVSNYKIENDFKGTQ